MSKGKSLGLKEELDVGGGVIVAPQPGGVPAYLQGYVGSVGTENIDSDDITVPRVEVAQDMHDAVQEGSLERGDLFLNLTEEKLAAAGKPLVFVPLATYKEFVLWRPRKDNGGGILARANKVKVGDGYKYEWNKPNTTFDVKVEGKIAVKWTTKRYIEDDGLGDWGSEIPGDSESSCAATAHHNYIIFLPEQGMVAALSLTRSKAKKAKAFNAMLKMGRVPLWARKFTIETFEDSADGNNFYNVNIKPAGFVEEGLAPQMEALFKDFQTKKVTVDQTDGGEVQDDRE